MNRVKELVLMGIAGKSGSRGVAAGCGFASMTILRVFSWLRTAFSRGIRDNAIR